MEFTVRQQLIIKELLRQETHTTGSYIASILGVSSRTIRSEMNEINQRLQPSNTQVISIPSKGYLIEKEDKAVIEQMIQDTFDYHIPNTKEERIYKMISDLLLSPAGLSVTDISKELYVSESTVKRDLEEVKTTLQNYHLALKQQNNRFIVTGNEEVIRHTYKEFFAKNGTTPVYNEYINSELISTYRFVKDYAIEHINQYDLHITGDQFQAMILHITIAKFRISHQSYIKNDDSPSYHNKWIQEFCEMLDFPTNEIIDVKRFYHKISHPMDTILDDMILTQTLQDVCTIYDFEYSERLGKIIRDSLQLNHTIQSIEYDPSHIKNEYPQCFEMTLHLIDQLEIETQYPNLITDICLAFITDFEEQVHSYETKPRRIAIVAQGNQVAQRFLKQKFKRYFGNTTIVGYYPIYALEYVKALDIDYIVSTSTIDDSHVPVILVDPMLTDYDITKIRTFLRHIDHRENIHYVFENTFREDLFLTNIEATNSFDVIKILYQRLLEKGYVNPTFLEAVLKRERLSSTAIGNLVAIPHAIQSDFSDNIIAVGILNKPIQWNQEYVQLVFLVNIKNTTDGVINQIFDSFYEIIESPTTVQHLIQSKNYYDFMKKITR